MDVVTRPPRQYEVWLITLDPTRGAEIKKTRPCLIVSPDEMNEYLETAIVAPLTSTIRPYPSRVGVTFQGRPGQIALDQIRSVARQRLVRKLGSVSLKTGQIVSVVLVEMFGREN
jgi:mRNA interferase MazF